MKKFDFNGLFVFDMANNHQGDVNHGLKIIQAMGENSKTHGVRGGMKFQFRELDTFIHPDYKKNKEVKHIPRFLGTRLSKDDYKKMTEEVKKQGMVTICTPFDEASVDLIKELNIEVIKVASCSASDTPLLEKIAESGKPVIVSTAGLSMNKIDRLVCFLEHKDVHFALMHCVALYPTPTEKLRLNQIDCLRARFPEIPIGFSTHEDPNDYSIVGIAYAKGASIFERHVGIENSQHKLNGYSSRPEQVSEWIKGYKTSVAMCGGEHRFPADPEEMGSLQSLMRGVYTNKKIKKGSPITREDVFFAMPLQDSQLVSGEWSPGLVADRNYTPNEPLSDKLPNFETPNSELIYQIMLQVRGMLNKGRIALGKESSIEISHHFGLNRFREYGAVIIDCINRKYCKKLVVVLPRQKHPYHFHKKKEETFQLLYGDLEVELEGRQVQLKPGDAILVEQHQWHKFHTLDGAIIEEVSTTHYNDDSFYEDEQIARLPRKKRKTSIPNWEAAVTDKL